MDNHIVIASTEEDGVRYDLVVRKVDPEAFAAGGPATIQQEPKVVASKAA
jgi:hypothetical protein